MTAITKKQAQFIEALASRVGQDTARETWQRVLDRDVPTYGAAAEPEVHRYAAYTLAKGEASA